MGIHLRQIAIGLVVFTTIMTGMLQFIGGAISPYDTASFDNDTLVSAAETADTQADRIAEDAEKRSKDVSGSQPLLDVGGFFINTIYQIAKLPLTALQSIVTIVNTLIGEVPTGFDDADGWPITLVSGILFVSAAFEVVKLYRGVET